MSEIGLQADAISTKISSFGPFLFKKKISSSSELLYSDSLLISSSSELLLQYYSSLFAGRLLRNQITRAQRE